MPAKVLRVRSSAAYNIQLTESDIRATEADSAVKMIFPNSEREFNAAGLEGIGAFRERNIGFGFIIEYEYLPGNIGEYGVIGEIHQRVTEVYTTITRDWSKEYGLRKRVRMALMSKAMKELRGKSKSKVVGLLWLGTAMASPSTCWR